MQLVRRDSRCANIATQGINGLPPWPLAAVALVCIGVIALGFTEANEDEELRRARQDASNHHYAKSWLAIALPVIYCLLDALGTFADQPRARNPQ